MDERGIIIADKDAQYRKEMAEFFEKAGYTVETTDSAVHVLCSILEKQTPVLLLGSDFDKKVSSADLIHLLKKCNRQLHVIMVSNEMPLAQARQVRQEGIFYHALKPSASGDTEEIGMAVQCAFEKRGKVDGVTAEHNPQRQTDVCCCAEKAPMKNPVETAQTFVALIVLVLGTSYLSLIAADWMAKGNHTAMWLFLGFCAAIIASQLMPIFRIKLPVRGSDQQPAKQQEEASRDGE